MSEQVREKIRRHTSIFYMNFTIPAFRILHGGRMLAL